MAVKFRTKAQRDEFLRRLRELPVQKEREQSQGATSDASPSTAGPSASAQQAR